MVTHVREWSLTVAEVTDLPRTHFNPHSRALAGWLYLIQSWDGVQDPSFSLPGIWQAARRGRQCSLASRRQVWCLLSAAIRPPVSPVGSPLESGVSPAHIGPRNACPRAAPETTPLWRLFLIKLSLSLSPPAHSFFIGPIVINIHTDPGL